MLRMVRASSGLEPRWGQVQNVEKSENVG